MAGGVTGGRRLAVSRALLHVSGGVDGVVAGGSDGGQGHGLAGHLLGGRAARARRWLAP